MTSRIEPEVLREAQIAPRRLHVRRVSAEACHMTWLCMCAGSVGSSVEDFVDCYAHITAEIFARAIATIFVRAFCGPIPGPAAAGVAETAVRAHVIPGGACCKSHVYTVMLHVW